MFSLRADGFSWADCVVVFEQLGRFCVPGPLVPSLLLGDGRIAGLVGPTTPPIWIEHLDALDVLLVGRRRRMHCDRRPACRRRRTFAVAARSVHPGRAWPSGCRPARRSHVDADAAGTSPGTALTAALQLGLADRLHRARGRVRQGACAVRPARSARSRRSSTCSPTCSPRTEVARAVGLQRGRRARRGRRPVSTTTALVRGAKVVAGDAAIANGKAATQVFGGMGFTWEVDVHLYLKRAWVLDTHFESADRNAEQVLHDGRRGAGPRRIPDATVMSMDALRRRPPFWQRSRERLVLRPRRSRTSTSPRAGESVKLHRHARWTGNRTASRTRSGSSASSTVIASRRCSTTAPSRSSRFFAALKLGAVQVPINTAYKGEFLRHQLADSGAKVFVVQGDFASARGRGRRRRRRPPSSHTASRSTRRTRSSTRCPTISLGRRALARRADARSPTSRPAGRSRVLHLHRGNDGPVARAACSRRTTS